VTGNCGANATVHETAADVARAGAERVAGWLSAAVSARGRATWLLDREAASLLRLA